jgi:hypothetical protein
LLNAQFVKVACSGGALNLRNETALVKAIERKREATNMFERIRDLSEFGATEATAAGVAEQKTRRLAGRLAAAFASGELGLEPHQTGFGELDYYSCPVCKARMNVRGSAYGRREIDDPAMTHNPGCVLVELKNLLSA